jgi:hypothetical protein
VNATPDSCSDKNPKTGEEVTITENIRTDILRNVHQDIQQRMNKKSEKSPFNRRQQ